MNKTYYLIRHGEPDFEGAIRRCLGSRTDIGLSKQGKLQARQLYPALEGIAIYASPLKRAMQTAELASDKAPIKLNGCIEMDFGELDGLTFEEIKSNFPDVYERRGADWSYCPPGTEDYKTAAKRAAQALNSISEEQAAVITHDGIIRALLVKYAGLDPKRDKMPKQPYGSIGVLKRIGDNYKFTAVGKLPGDLPNECEIDDIMELCQVDNAIRAHMEEVSKVTRQLCEKLVRAGCDLNVDLAVKAAKLHDIMRPQGRSHPKAARDFLAERGYLTLGNVISKHHDIEPDGKIDEASVLYLSDKMVCGVDRVDIHSRFKNSRDKCNNEEARRNHERRYDAAIEIENSIKSILNR